MSYSLTWLADTLRAAGLTVVEQPGWKTRGRGEMGPVKGVIDHHTGGAKTGDHPSLNLVQNGRPDLAGPLSQLFLARSGTWYVVAAGRCNHAGPGAWHGVTAGNSSMIGVEAENAGDGTDPWPEVQIDSYARGVAAILKHIGADENMTAGHKEWATPRGRKIDPAFAMNLFRARVAGFIGGLASPVPIPVLATNPHASMLQRGDRGEDVKLLQGKLGIKADGDFGPATEAAVKAFQASHALKADGLVGPKTWTALG